MKKHIKLIALGTLLGLGGSLAVAADTLSEGAATGAADIPPSSVDTSAAPAPVDTSVSSIKTSVSGSTHGKKHNQHSKAKSKATSSVSGPGSAAN